MAPIAILTLPSASVQELEVQSDSEESCEDDECVMDNQPHAVKMYRVVQYSLSDIIHPFANMASSHGIVTNQFIDGSNYEGSTVGDLPHHGPEDNSRNMSARQSVLAASSGDRQAGPSNANVIGFDNALSRGDAGSSSVKKGADLEQDPGQPSSAAGPVM